MFDMPSFDEIEIAAPLFAKVATSTGRGMAVGVVFGNSNGGMPLIQAALAGQMLHVG